jgi:imidazole glycerol-phosphate synthase subunit HisH|tara:strand:- start:327 stop:944 length:618 start_codon:yes stop_codon:yes gene_type:complete
MIGILNYGLGNIKAFSNIYKSLDIPYKVISKREELVDIKKIILPGVGAFDNAMNKFNQSGLRESVEKMVLNEHVPLLGVCVGLQMLGRSSDEGEEKGLGWIDAHIRLLDTSNIPHMTKLPHMGWNTIDIKKNNELLFKNLKSQDRFYFLHSYYFDCENNDNIIAQTHYGLNFTCAAKLNNIYGVQFHPEKSLKNGEKLLYNFSQL